MPNSPLMSESETAAFLGTTEKLLKHWRIAGKLHWYQQTRTFARAEVEALAAELEQEILENARTMGRIEQTMGSQPGLRKSASVLP
jgi:membrane protein required for beta-lactamase induction